MSSLTLDSTQWKPAVSSLSALRLPQMPLKFPQKPSLTSSIPCNAPATFRKPQKRIYNASKIHWKSGVLSSALLVDIVVPNFVWLGWSANIVQVAGLIKHYSVAFLRLLELLLRSMNHPWGPHEAPLTNFQFPKLPESIVSWLLMLHHYRCTIGRSISRWRLHTTTWYWPGLQITTIATEHIHFSLILAKTKPILVTYCLFCITYKNMIMIFFLRFMNLFQSWPISHIHTPSQSVQENGK